MSPLEKISEWAANVTVDHSVSAYATATNAYIDTIGCMLRGSSHPVSSKTCNTVRTWGIGSATAVGFAVKLPPPFAALVNGTSAHAHDFDDWELPGSTHPSAALVPALLAVAEARHKSGRAVLDAYIVGMEVLMRIGEAVNMAHYHCGWHTTATLGSLGAAAGCARLLGGDAGQIGSAVSLASSRAAGFRSQFGTDVKPLHAGMAAQTGVLAAALALAGISGSKDVLDGEWSLASLQSDRNAADFDVPLAKLNQSLAIDEYGVAVKLYPSCAYTHPAIDGLLAIRERERFSTADIVRVSIHMPGQDAKILLQTVPGSGAEAKFYLPYCAAVALVKGSVDLDDFSDQKICDARITALQQRVSVKPYPILETSSDIDFHEPVLVEVEMKNGQIFFEKVDDVQGSPEKPLLPHELWNKFRRLSEPIASAATLDQLQSLLPRLKQLDNIRGVMELLGATPRP